MVRRPKRQASQKRTFSATDQFIEAGILDLRHSISSRAARRLGAMGFSERTCLPAERAFLMISGWMRIGRLRIHVVISNCE